MLARFRIRQKLALLIAVPLLAVVVVMVPYVAERVGEARAAGTTARTADAAREIGSLIQALQRERLLALAYLSAPNLNRSALIAQSQTAIDDAARLRGDPALADAMARAVPALDSLATTRTDVLARRTRPLTAYSAYRAATGALLDGMRLTAAPGVDAPGLGPLAALDALMRSNEEASGIGAMLVVAAARAANRTTVQTAVADAADLDRRQLARFRELAPADQAQLVDTVDGGQVGSRIRGMVIAVVEGVALSDDLSQALTAAVSYTDLRRLAQDHIAREIATAAEGRAEAAESTATGVTLGAVALFVIVFGLGYTVSRSISEPLRRLTRAATQVAELSRAELVRVADSDVEDHSPPPRLTEIDIDSADEIGELAAALNQVQTTAAGVLERQVTARRNTAVMFANIGRRTQNLAGRQLSLIDDLARDERDPRRLDRVYRLDTVATRLRRSADSLMVVSGTIDQLSAGGPAALHDVIMSAVNETEGVDKVDVTDVSAVTVNAAVVADLRLLLAELLDNATHFSPPGTRVEVSAGLGRAEGDGGGQQCTVSIVDHGLGMSATRLDEENQRLIERERLDVAPTTMLGMFVVGRLARRHGLTVRLHPSPERGVTATVDIPTRLLANDPVGATAIGSGVTPRRPRRSVAAALDALDALEPRGSFAWFRRDRTPAGSDPGRPPATDQPGSGEPSTAEETSAVGVASVSGGGLGATVAAVPPATWDTTTDEDTAPIDPAGPQGQATGFPPAVWGPPSPADWEPPVRGPVTAAARVPPPRDSYSRPETPDAAAPPPAYRPPPASPRPYGTDAPAYANGGSPTPAGLARRVPGSHLAPEFRDPPSPAAPPVAGPPRDPGAEREALNDFFAGLARGGDPAVDPRNPTVAERHP
jgi:signal transduction histidine kinase